MPSENGESAQPRAALELEDILHIETQEGLSLPFEVVGILEDPDEGSAYAVLLHEPEDDDDDQFIVTDLSGNLLENDRLAQEILDDFLAYARDTNDGGAGDAEAD